MVAIRSPFCRSRLSYYRSRFC